MYYMPAVIELVEALVMPSRRDQTTYPWQVKVPEPYIGRAFIDVLTELVLGCSLVGDEEDGPQSPGNHSQAERCLGPPAVPIALYRLRIDFSHGAAIAEGFTGFEAGPQHRMTAQEV